MIHFLAIFALWFFMWMVMIAIRGDTIKPPSREWWAYIWVSVFSFLIGFFERMP